MHTDSSYSTLDGLCTGLAIYVQGGNDNTVDGGVYNNCIVANIKIESTKSVYN